MFNRRASNWFYLTFEHVTQGEAPLLLAQSAQLQRRVGATLLVSEWLPGEAIIHRALLAGHRRVRSAYLRFFRAIDIVALEKTITEHRYSELSYKVWPLAFDIFDKVRDLVAERSQFLLDSTVSCQAL